RETRDRCLHFVNRRHDELEEALVVLLLVDEDEATRVLQLALHRHQVELVLERFALFRFESVRAREVIEPRRDETAIELLVTVTQKRHDVVDTRTEKRILKIDPAKLSLRSHHQIARLIVAMDETARPRGDRLCESIGNAIERAAVIRRERYAARFETPLAKM